jgi:hypothetical protein
MDSARLARVALFTLASAFVVARPSSADADSTVSLVIVADRDDDDADGKPDGSQDFVPPAGRVDMVQLDRRFYGAVFHAESGGDRVRILVDGVPFAWEKPTTGSVWVQGQLPGTARLVATKAGRRETLDLRIRGVGLRDGANARVDMARSHASLERTPPARVDPSPDATYDDPDALRFVLELPEPVGAGEAKEIVLESVSAIGSRVDVLPHLPVARTACVPAISGVACFASPPVRLVIDDVDRNHPLVDARSMRAELGGAVVVRIDGKKSQEVRVLGPRDTAAGTIGRLRAELRAFVLRVTPGGAPAVGGTDAGGVAAMRAELAAASAIWSQCGLSFGDPKTLEAKIVDPPTSYLVAFGDDAGLPATGGEVRVRIDGRAVSVKTTPGATVDRVASDFARAVEKAGFVAVVSPNARIGPGAAGSVDVMVRRKDGAFATVDAVPAAPATAAAPVSTDPTLVVRIGSVDLSDGLQHFTDMDAMAGTLEERTLLKALDDGDPRTIEVVVVPLFAGGGRIGESFIGSDSSSLRNVVLLDRAGIRARKSSLTLAHELGHVLMDMPGHPDDYGVDTPTLLMDSDASDASPFGPRRITRDECARVVRQAGPKARVPLLTEWPVVPIPADTRPLVGN